MGSLASPAHDLNSNLHSIARAAARATTFLTQPRRSCVLVEGAAEDSCAIPIHLYMFSAIPL